MFIPLTVLEGEFLHDTAAHGMCRDCGTVHSLPFGQAKHYARLLMAELEAKGDMLLPIPTSVGDHERIQAEVDALAGNPRYSMEYLWGKALGQMLGVMVCRQQDGTVGIVRAFSGQYDRLYEIPGWAPPVVDLAEYNRVNSAGNKVVNELSERVDALAARAESNDELAALQELKRQRKACSRELMDKLYNLYVLQNFKGEKRLLREAFYSRQGMRTGTADCCAPKLITYAQRHGLTPLGIAEFFYGAENKSKTRQHGTFYEACREKCQPILGFMLCGLDAPSVSDNG
ncbi:MAG: hypothetical protein MI749_17770 [Desulfovibrionales bacterium]|nr:hypothetical protein [Desulfovibrionales bacterium]